jgi:hypothetical protein
MSAMPPPPPPPPPPIEPPPVGALPGVIPWEERARYGFLESLVETVKLFVTMPAEAWRRTPEKGNLLNPLLFAILVSWVGALFSAIYSMFFTVPWLRMLPAGMRERMPMTGHAAGFFVQGVFAPVFIAFGLFIGSAILHVCLMLVGGLASSTAGFDGTFRALSYSAVADLANAIPFFGGLVAAVWKIVLVVIGFTVLHKTTQGKAIAAVLIPVVLCCGCVMIAGTVIMGMIFGAMHR